MRKQAVSAILALLLVLGVLPVSIGAAPADQTTMEPFPVCTERYGQVQPAIDYPWVVWKDERAGEDSWRTNIYAYNFETGEEVPVCTVLGEQSNPDIDAGRVVYSDDRLDPYYYGDECNIYMYDLNTGLESVVASETDSQGNPSISGDRVVWIDWRVDDGDGDSSEIYMKDLVTGEITNISEAEDNQREPVIDGDHVVWRSDDGHSDVVLKDLGSGETTVVGEGVYLGWGDGDYYESHCSDPYVADGYVAYRKYENIYTPSGGWQYPQTIHLYEIATGIDTVVSTVADNTSRWHPETGGGWVVWPDRRNGDVEVFGYNIESQEETCLVPAGYDDVLQDDYYAGRAAVADGIVAWHDHRSEPDGSGDNSDYSDLYAMFLEDNWAPEVAITGVEDGATYDATVTPDATVDDETAVVEATLNGDPFVLGSEVADEGDYDLVVTATDEAGNVGEATASFTIDFPAPPAQREVPAGVTRVAGTDRYATAIEASKRAFPDGTETVVIATGENWPDALSGAALAGAADGSLLLSHSAALDVAVAQEIARLGASHAYILGGVSALSPSVEAALVTILGADNVERLAGLDRYATSRVVAEETIKVAGDRFDGSAFIATGGDFPDALAASPVAGSLCMPVVLASPAAAEVFQPSAITEAVILGGTGAVSATIESALKADLGADAVSRIGGTNRYETAAMIAEAGVADGMHWNGVGIATGTDFPDALSGGAMLGAYDTVMLLTPPDALHAAAKAKLEANADDIEGAFILGGTGAVSAAVEAAVKAALGL